MRIALRTVVGSGSQGLTTDFDAWCRSASPIASGHAVILRGLSSAVQAEILFGLQERCRRGVITYLYQLRIVTRHLRGAGVVTIADFEVARLPGHVSRLAQELQEPIARGITAEAEQHKDVWDMGVFGHGRKRLDFTVIVELWLRDAAKLWVLEELPLRRGPNVVGVLSLGNDVSRAKSFNPHRFLPHTWEWSEAPVQAQPICETHYALPVHQVRAGSRPDRRTRDGISTPCVISDARDRAGRRPPGDNGWLTRCMMCEGRVRRPAPDSCVAGGEG